MAIDLLEPRLVLIAAAIALAAILSPRVGFAQHAPDRAQAKQMYKQGTAAFYRSDYPQAILYFRRAYQLDPNAMPLYNIAVAYGKLGNFEEARKAGIEAREEGGLPRGVDERNEARIAAFSLILTARTVAETPATEPADVDAQAGRTPEVSAPSVHRPRHDEQARSMSGVGWTGVIGAGAGAVGLGLAGYYALEVDQAQSAFDNAPAPTHRERKAGAEEIEQMRSFGRVSLFAGAALAAGGVALLSYDLFGRDDAKDAAHVSARASGAPGGARVELQIEF